MSALGKSSREKYLSKKLIKIVNVSVSPQSMRIGPMGKERPDSWK